jgi:aspartate carbamoyltransferase catalytic subunit
MTTPLHRKNLISINDFGKTGIEEAMTVAASFAEVNQRQMPKVPTLKGKAVATIFFEKSTRTRFSFETAAKRLSADVLSLTVGTSSVEKGESLRDTVETIEAMGIDLVIVRHKTAGAATNVASWTKRACVVNAGDGWHEHPSQALIDLYSVAEVLAENDPHRIKTGMEQICGLSVVIVGDIRHSRVARSEVLAYSALGANVTLAGPASLLPSDLSRWPVTVAHDYDEALRTADVVSLLRLQEERGSGAFVPSLREYAKDWGISTERAGVIGKHAVITHPGPIMRGVEIEASVMDDDRFIALRQVRNGIPVRMAILYLLLSNEALSRHMAGDTRG